MTAEDVRREVCSLPGVASAEVTLRVGAPPLIRVWTDGTVPDADVQRALEKIAIGDVSAREDTNQRRIGLGRNLGDTLPAAFAEPDPSHLAEPESVPSRLAGDEPDLSRLVVGESIPSRIVVDESVPARLVVDEPDLSLLVVDESVPARPVVDEPDLSRPTADESVPSRLPAHVGAPNASGRFLKLAIEETTDGVEVRAVDDAGREAGAVVAPGADGLTTAVAAAVARLRGFPPPRGVVVNTRDVDGATVVTVLIEMPSGARAAGAAMVTGGLPFTVGRAVDGAFNGLP
jgi:hypothetical protein